MGGRDLGVAGVASPVKRAAGIAFLSPTTSAVLLAKRSARVGSFMGYWATPGGMVEPGESDFEAALREVEEEFGIYLEDFSSHVAYVIGSVQTTKLTTFTTFAVEVEPWEIGPISLNEENTDVCWVSISDPFHSLGPNAKIHPGTQQLWPEFVRAIGVMR